VLPSAVVETIYSPFQYIIGLHTHTPEMDSYVHVNLNDKIVRHIRPPYKIPPQIQKDITKFEAVVPDYPLDQGFREFILALIAYVVKTDPLTLVAAYNKMAAESNGEK
jgi:hypothetical protein